jgi:hypothetical protein
MMQKEINIEYKEAKDFEKSAFVVSLEQFRDLEKDLEEAISLAEALFEYGGYAYNPEGRIKELREKYEKRN